MEALDITEKAILSQAVLGEFTKSCEFKYRAKIIIKIAVKKNLYFVPDMIKLFNHFHSQKTTINDFTS